MNLIKICIFFVVTILMGASVASADSADMVTIYCHNPRFNHTSDFQFSFPATFIEEAKQLEPSTGVFMGVLHTTLTNYSASATYTKAGQTHADQVTPENFGPAAITVYSWYRANKKMYSIHRTDDNDEFEFTFDISPDFKEWWTNNRMIVKSVHDYPEKVGITCVAK